MRVWRNFLFSSEAETLPIPLLEARAARGAILTNTPCSMPEVRADAVAYAEPVTAERDVAGLLRLLDDETHRGRLTSAAERRAGAPFWRDTG